MENINRYLLIALAIFSCVDLNAQQFFFSAVRPSTCTSADGIVTLVPTRGVPPFAYSWSNGATDLSLKNVPKGNYSVTMTDATGTTVTHTHILNSETFDLYLSDTKPVTFCNPNSGALSLDILGGVAPFTYQWSDGQTSSTAAALPTGDYSVTVLDATGCTALGIYTVPFQNNQYFPQAMIVSLQSPDCINTNAGSLRANLTRSGYGPYSYTWSDGSTDQTLNNLSPATYSVTITDALGCSSSKQFILKNNLDITGSVVCTGSNTGTASALLTNGTAPIAYTWNNGGSGPALSNLSSGAYTVTATDSNGCISEGFAVVSIPKLITHDATPDCYVGNAGLASVWVNGDNAVSYLWSNGSTDSWANTLSPGANSVTVTTGLGCVLTTTVSIPAALAAPFGITTFTTPADCANGLGGALNINITGGLASYNFYAYGPDGFISTNTASLQNLAAGSYYLNVSSVFPNQCSSNTTVVVSDQGGFEPELIVENIDCITGVGSAAVLNASASGVQYNWSTGSTSQDIFNLTPGSYTVTVTGFGSCVAYMTAHLFLDDTSQQNSNCFGLAQGTLINDLGVPSCTGTQGLPFQLIRTLPSGALNFTDINGVFQIQLPDGTFDLEPASYDLNDIACPAGGFHTVNSVVGTALNNLDFHFFNTNTNDHRIRQRALRTAQPGFPYSLRVEVCNDGNAAINGSVDLSFANFFGSVLNNSFSQNPGTFTLTSETNGSPNNAANFTFVGISPNGCELFQFDFETPTTAPVNTEFETVARVEPLAGDPTPDNNITAQRSTVVGSFDPNSVFSFPARNGNPRDGGDILKNVDNRIKYQIFFQNTGTAPADLVVIRDTMDAELTLTSIQNIQASHEVRVSIEGENNDVLVFKFPNIHLPDSTSDYANSIGSVSYDIDLQGNLPVGTEVTKQAAIYFDFNSPIITNQNKLTVVETTATQTPQKEAEKLHIFPNPAQEYMGLYSSKAGEMRVYSAAGALVSQQMINSGLQQISTISWPNGVYFVQLDMGASIQHGKVVVSH